MHLQPAPQGEAVLIEVLRLQDAGRVYTRHARMRGIPPSKEPLKAVPGRSGPVKVLCRGAYYTLYRGGKPCPAA